jgi:hypothetical protein
MTTVAEISGAVRRLPKRDLARFRKWFAEYDAAAWDRQVERDVVDGRLAKLAREALDDLRAAAEGGAATGKSEPCAAEGRPPTSGR